MRRLAPATDVLHMDSRAVEVTGSVVCVRGPLPRPFPVVNTSHYAAGDLSPDTASFAPGSSPVAALVLKGASTRKRSSVEPLPGS